MEQMNQAYKVFTRICLNNWHYIDRKVLGLNESINFFTGHSGSGKSTVIDAMQIVLYANTDGRGFFNKAAADDSDRSLIEYLRGMINIGENNQAEYKRNKNFSTTIVLEMEQTITKEKECIGVVFDVETATNEINRLFFWHKGELIPGDYRTERRAMTISEVRSYLQQNFPKDEMFYTSNNERFRRNLYDVYLGGLDMEKFPLLFKRAIPFRMNIRLEDFVKEYRKGIRRTYLLYGITGSGKTEVYMQLLSEVLAEGKQAIVLIPEIALTFQTVSRFQKRFPGRVSVLHSRLSEGERADQIEMAKNGDIDIMIGPRSALFTPFERLGIIIMDEEHETSYISESSPRYHTDEVAVYRAKLAGASVVLGSATPSVKSYQAAKEGRYKEYRLTKRAGNAALPNIDIVDLREELKAKNRSVFSRLLQQKLQECLAKGEQAMLFINRRGYAGFVSCRNCGNVIQCSHCDVSMTAHKNHVGDVDTLVCHYCGHSVAMPERCPECGSPYIATFGLGTQKVEEMLRHLMPKARILRMDADTTTGKNGHEGILSAFREGKADILIGTQMIVKGHDFPNVTLVGVLAADLSLYVSDYHAAERTFQLLTQAAGRAGRGEKPGEVIIQTYNPEHYSVICAKNQDYNQFYEEEIFYRQAMRYPPVWHMLVVLCASKEEAEAYACAKELADTMEKVQADKKLQMIGPADAAVAKVNDIYKKVLYFKHPDYGVLIQIKDKVEQLMEEKQGVKNISVQFDFDPVNGF